MNSMWRPVHYLGNKSRYVTQIAQKIGEVAPDGSAVVDLFAGTGAVSRALAERHPVISADIQAYSAVLASALCAPLSYDTSSRHLIIAEARAWIRDLRPAVARLLQIEAELMETAPQDPIGFARLVEEGSLVGSYATDPRLEAAKAEAAPVLKDAGAILTKYYGGAYFSYRQALELDALKMAIHHDVGSPAEPTLVAALLGAASDIVASVGGHFAQPPRLRSRIDEPKHAAIKKSLDMRRKCVFEVFDSRLLSYGEMSHTPYPCTAITADFRVALEGIGPEVAAIYADPPYTRDHYSRFYHVLETIAVGDDPGVAKSPRFDRPSRGLYRLERHQSPFSIRTQVAAAFDALFDLARERDLPVVLSYSPQGGGTRARPETRLMTIDQLVNIASERFPRVEVNPIIDSTHSRFNTVDLHGTTPDEAEVLLIARD